jgi:flagellar hook-associated protein 1 FlgK
MVNDFHRVRKEVDEIRRHIDSRIEGYCTEVNATGDEIRNLNIKIGQLELSGASANDLLDQRDQLLKKLGTYADLSMHKDSGGAYSVDLKGIGPFLAGPNVERLSVKSSPADEFGKAEGSLDVYSTGTAGGKITQQLQGGKLGALIESRDHVLATVIDRLDELAFQVSEAVNGIHEQGFTLSGQQGISFFGPLQQRERAAEFLTLSEAVRDNVSNIATAAQPESPGDNRIAIAISGLQGIPLLNGGAATVDDWYNSIVSDVGVATSKNRFGMNQQRDIMTQLGKMRDQISGVSIDEETANLMQFQHAFDASAKVIQVADEMLKTVLELKR